MMIQKWQQVDYQNSALNGSGLIPEIFFVNRYEHDNHFAPWYGYDIGMFKGPIFLILHLNLIFQQILVP